jgi:hypothetical protein
MAIDLQAGGHRFDFITGLCMRCKMSIKKFEDHGRPLCTGRSPAILALAPMGLLVAKTSPWTFSQDVFIYPDRASARRIFVETQKVNL